MVNRKKLSTTVATQSYHYLQKMVKAGKAESVGGAVDRAVEIARRLDDRAALDRETARYFGDLAESIAAEENEIESALSAASEEFDFDQP